MEEPGSSQRRGWEILVLGAFWVASASGCATYSDHLREARSSAIAHQPDRAASEINKALKVADSHTTPRKLSGKNTLFLLERATMLQALGEYKLAARDMMTVDQQLDWLDIAAQGKVKIGKYMYSGASVKYRAPAYERVLLNALNAINFLALRDWEGAKVEARRFQIIETFFRDEKAHSLEPGTLRFANYLGGIAFEAAGDYIEALRYYSRAWHYGMRWSRLARRIEALAAMTARAPSELVDLNSKVLERFESSSRTSDPIDPTTYRKRFVDGELVAVVQTGFVPYKEPERYPLLGALSYVDSRATYGGIALTASEREQARELAVSGALKWVNFPALTDDGLPPTRSVDLRVGGTRPEVHEAADVAGQVQEAWERMSPSLMVAAISRTITRAVAGEGTRRGARAAAQEAGASDGNASLIGFLAQILVEGSMTVADKPDTRSWSFLPGRVRIARYAAEPGEREVSVEINGHATSRTVKIHERGPTVVNFSRLR